MKKQILLTFVVTFQFVFASASHARASAPAPSCNQEQIQLVRTACGRFLLQSNCQSELALAYTALQHHPEQIRQVILDQLRDQRTQHIQLYLLFFSDLTGRETLLSNQSNLSYSEIEFLKQSIRCYRSQFN